MDSAVSSCLVLRDLVWYAGPSLVGSSFGTGAGNLIRFFVWVAMGDGVGCCDMPRITFGSWIDGNLGVTLGYWISDMVGVTLGA